MMSGYLGVVEVSLRVPLPPDLEYSPVEVLDWKKIELVQLAKPRLGIPRKPHSCDGRTTC